MDTDRRGAYPPVPGSLVVTDEDAARYQLGAGGDTFRADPDLSVARLPAEVQAGHEGQERLDDDGDDGLGSGEVLAVADCEAHDQLIQADAEASATPSL